MNERQLKQSERGFVAQGLGYFPVLIKLGDGSLAAVVRSGAAHVGVGGRLDFVRSTDGGRTWTPPQMVVYMPPDSRNPALGQAVDGTIVLAFSVTGPYPQGRFDRVISGQYSVWLTWSKDGGATWLPPQPLPLASAHGSPFGKIIHLSDGTMLLPIYLWDGAGRRDSCVLRSTDNGRTWSEPHVMAEQHTEAALTALPDDTVLAVVRTAEGGMSECYSSDGGRTWTPPQKVTEKNFHPADVIVLKSGRVLMTFGRRMPPFGVEAVLGEMDGSRVRWLWDTRTLLEWQAANTDCGYPSSAQCEDGAMVTLYYGVGRSDGSAQDAFCAWVRFSVNE